MSFAALALGGYVLVPIVHVYGRKEVSFILEESAAAAYVSPLSYGHVDYGEIVATAAPGSLRLHVVVGEGDGGARRSGPARAPWDACTGRAPAAELSRVRPDAVAVLAYTSGTTSDPKGVIHDHRTLLAELRHTKAYMTPGHPKLWRI